MSNLLRFLYITGDVEVAELAIGCGADQIMVDLERLGKATRQAGRNTWISDHTLETVRDIVAAVGPEHVIVRANPLNGDSREEISGILDAGATHVMQPMFDSLQDVTAFASLLPLNVNLLPLAETAAAVAAVADLAAVAQVSDIHIGLNDLQISMGSAFMFEPVVSGQLEAIANRCQGAGLGFGFGGIARIAEGVVPPEFLLAWHVRLRSRRVILSRTFRSGDGTDDRKTRQRTFREAVLEIRDRESELRSMDDAQLTSVCVNTQQLIQAEIDRRLPANNVR